MLRLDTGMPSIKVVPEGDHSRQGYGGSRRPSATGRPGALQVVAPGRRMPEAARSWLQTPASPRWHPPRPAPTAWRWSRRSRVADPSSAAFGDTVDRAARRRCPAGALVGGAAAENHDLERALAAKTPLVIGVVLALGFLLLLVAFQAPLIAAIGVLANLLATGAAFGVATLIFQDGHLSGLLGFSPRASSTPGPPSSSSR